MQIQVPAFSILKVVGPPIIGIAVGFPIVRTIINRFRQTSSELTNSLKNIIIDTIEECYRHLRNHDPSTFNRSVVEQLMTQVRSQRPGDDQLYDQHRTVLVSMITNEVEITTERNLTFLNRPRDFVVPPRPQNRPLEDHPFLQEARQFIATRVDERDVRERALPRRRQSQNTGQGAEGIPPNEAREGIPEGLNQQDTATRSLILELREQRMKLEQMQEKAQGEGALPVQIMQTAIENQTETIKITLGMIQKQFDRDARREEMLTGFLVSALGPRLKNLLSEAPSSNPSALPSTGHLSGLAPLRLPESSRDSSQQPEIQVLDEDASSSISGTERRSSEPELAQQTPSGPPGASEMPTGLHPIYTGSSFLVEGPSYFWYIRSEKLGAYYKAYKFISDSQIECYQVVEPHLDLLSVLPNPNCDYLVPTPNQEIDPAVRRACEVAILKQYPGESSQGRQISRYTVQPPPSTIRFFQVAPQERVQIVDLPRETIHLILTRLAKTKEWSIISSQDPWMEDLSYDKEVVDVHCILSPVPPNFQYKGQGDFVIAINLGDFYYIQRVEGNYQVKNNEVKYRVVNLFKIMEEKMRRAVEKAEREERALANRGTDDGVQNNQLGTRGAPFASIQSSWANSEVCDILQQRLRATSHQRCEGVASLGVSSTQPCASPVEGYKNPFSIFMIVLVGSSLSFFFSRDQKTKKLPKIRPF